MPFHEGALDFSRDGRKLITSASAEVIRVFDVAANTVVKLTEVGGPFHTLALTTDGNSLISTANGVGPSTISLADAKVINNTYSGDDYLKSAVMSPDGKWVVAGTNRGAICLWKSVN